MPDLTADPALAEKELGFHAGQDLETMCKDLWNWQSKNPEGYSTPAVKPVDLTTSDWVEVPSAASLPIQTDDLSKLPKAPSDSGKPHPTVAPDHLDSSLVVEPPTIPTLAELRDPHTPAHLTPAAVDERGRKELTPGDVFIDQKIVEDPW